MRCFHRFYHISAPFRCLAAVLMIVQLLAVPALPFSLGIPVQAADSEPIIVVLDAGHGGMDGGTVAGIRPEKVYTLLVAQYMQEALADDSRFRVVMTRTDDTGSKILPRADLARRENADLFLSLHFNSAAESYVRGSMAFVSVVERFRAADLAEKLLDAIKTSTGIPVRGVEVLEDTGDSLGVYYWNEEKQWDMPGAWQLGQKSDYYSVNTWGSKFGIPSMILECGYVSNPTEAALLDRDKTLRDMADALAGALVSYYTGHTHTYGERTVDYPSNCVFAGTSSRRCTICGAKTETEPLPAAPDAHYYRILSEKKPTCTEAGYTESVCQISYNLHDRGYACDVHTLREEFPALGHTYDVTEDTQPSHGKDGRRVQTCRTCGDTIVEVRPGEPHTYRVTASVAPTCTEPGKTVYTCAVCGASYEEILSAPGHDFREKEHIPAADGVDGRRILVCARCGEEKTVIEPACEHVFTTEEIPPTCTGPGKKTETCTLCGYVRETELPPAGHHYVEQMRTEATCTEPGFYKGKCDVCGDIITEQTPVLPHIFEVKEENRREIVRVCKICGFEQVEKKEPVQPVQIFIGVLLCVPVVLGVVLLFVRHGPRPPRSSAPEKSVPEKSVPEKPVPEKPVRRRAVRDLSKKE